MEYLHDRSRGQLDLVAAIQQCIALFEPVYQRGQANIHLTLGSLMTELSVELFGLTLDEAKVWVNPPEYIDSFRLRNADVTTSDSAPLPGIIIDDMNQPKDM